MKDIIYEIIGSILIIRESTEETKLRKFSEDMLKKYPSIKTVVVQVSKIEGIERSRKFQHFMGQETFKTAYKEYGNLFELDISTTFFSPRLSYERQRIAKLVQNKEIILNFFSGVGPFSIAIAKKCKECIIHSVELNENAYHYFLRNIELNNCTDQIKTYLGDAFDIVPKMFFGKVDRVLLPLPLEAERSLPLAFQTLIEGKGTIHWQVTEKVTEKERTKVEIKQQIQNIFEENNLNPSFKINNVRTIRWLAPRVAHRAIDLVFN